jgi:serralysin
MAYPTAAQVAPDILYPSDYWSGPTITYSFPTTGGQWSGYAATGSEPTDANFGVVNAGQAANLRAALAAWDQLIAPSLVETAETGQIRIAFTDVQTGDNGANTWGYTFPPPGNGGQGGAQAGDVWIDYHKEADSFAAGTYDYLASLHELGHALGLKHTFEDGPTLPAEYDSYRYSVMSYTRNADAYLTQITRSGDTLTGTHSAVYPTTPMVFDIAAIQSRYGADPATAAGDTTYSFDQDKPTFLSIYDAGGVDTIDLSGHTRGSIVDLTPGAYSSIDHYALDDQKAAYKALYPSAASFVDRVFDSATFTWTDNVGIAFGTVIENVRGGSAADSILGNDAANNIGGGAGNDTISGGVGQDYLRGDDGNDSITGGADFDDINGNRGDDTVYGGEGGDWVVGGQDQDLLFGENGNDVVYGNLGNDTVNGGAGDDWVRGGQGDDVVEGGAGNDLIWGDRGNDTVAGGAGADMFHTFVGAGVDRVTDFNGAEGDRIVIDDHVDYTVTASGGDTIITLAGTSDTLVLQGVALSSFHNDWVSAA